MATTREQAKATREAKLDELHERLTGAVERLVSGEDDGGGMHDPGDITGGHHDHTHLSAVEGL